MILPSLLLAEAEYRDLALHYTDNQASITIDEPHHIVLIFGISRMYDAWNQINNANRYGEHYWITGLREQVPDLDIEKVDLVSRSWKYILRMNSKRELSITMLSPQGEKDTDD